MKAITIRRYGGPEVLELAERAAPEPGAGEVLVRVRAASVNPIDWQIRDGLVKMFVRPKFPAVLGADLAGEVVALGAGVTSFAIGDEVFAMMPEDYGAQAELVALPAKLVARKPAKLSMVEAASVPATATTALHALRDHGKVGPGSEVLINGASGGVGIFAVQIAKDLGARVTAVCGAANAALVRELGADAVIDYKATDFTKGTKKFDVILDAVGNAPYHACKAVLRGAWVHITLQPRPRTFLRSFFNRFTKGKVVPMIAEASANRIEYIRGHLEAGTLRTVVDRVLPAAAVAEAQAHSKSGRAKGKIVLTF